MPCTRHPARPDTPSDPPARARHLWTCGRAGQTSGYPMPTRTGTPTEPNTTCKTITRNQARGSRLRLHLEEFGEAEGGRVFGNERRKPIGASTYSRVWEEARELALTPAQVLSPLGGRPYDLRHSCLTGWLNAGVPPAEVARRAGNSVEVLYRRYAGCLDGQEDAVNRRIEAALE
jgi:integrase